MTIMASKFLSTPSARRATLPAYGHAQHLVISIHALREEGDRSCWRRSRRRYPFLSTPSARRATAFGGNNPQGIQISIHALREEGDFRAGRRRAPSGISIHALREEGDSTDQSDRANHVDFYPRPPRGGRHFLHNCYIIGDGFLSTPSARRATQNLPCCARCLPISIHALREEGDDFVCAFRADSIDFYPRPPRGGRLVAQKSCGHIGIISIHALREEGDGWVDFVEMIIPRIFLSTPSARRATFDGRDFIFL